ncbi:MAG: transcriptional regulator [Desulfobulbaceae bacterium]|nr:MAG: transcriptional regulator [Desulfobulbaceae bacterium]
MKKKETIPRERNLTIRQELMHLLAGQCLSVSLLSREIRLSEKEIYSHLEQMQRTGILNITPARCTGCGYLFAKRNRLKKPGKCPQCKGTHIEQPLFSIATGR